MDRYTGDVISFEIGNEPDVFEKTYEGYKSLFENISHTVKATEYAPDALFCGPNTTPGQMHWVDNFAKDFGDSGEMNLLTQHAYFGGNSRLVKDQAAARGAMLSRQWAGKYWEMAGGMMVISGEHKLPYRIEETNSFYNGGAKDVSNSFASALWGLDYLYWWASHGASGLNFHTGDKVAAGRTSRRRAGMRCSGRRIMGIRRIRWRTGRKGVCDGIAGAGCAGVKMGCRGAEHHGVWSGGGG